jgi:predicted nucleic acid-binding protein
MRAGYLDTSVLVAIAFDEPEGRRLARQLRSFDEVLSSPLLESEFLAAAEREGAREQASRLLDPVTWIFLDRRLTSEIREILDHGSLKGADLHHLATALYLFPDPGQVRFLTLDRHQERVARKLGFRILE